MRKDVKLGFAIGGVLLAVLIVYVLVVPGGGDKRLSSATGGDASSQTADGNDVTLEPVVPPVPPPVSPSTGEAGGSGAVAQGPASPPPAPPATFDPASSGTDPFEQPRDEPVANADSRSKDVDWSKLLNDSQVLMVPEPTPTGQATTPAVQTSAEKSGDGSAATATPSVPDITRPGPTPIVPPAVEENDPAPSKREAVAEATSPPAAGDAEVAGPPPAPAPAPVEQQESPPQDPAPTVVNSDPAAGQQTHVVQAGESFSTIAMTAYGNPNLYLAIMRANPGVEPTKLRPGMKIVIPPLSEVQPAPAPPAVATGTPVSGDAAQTSASKIESPIDPQTQYRVQAGDSLYSIAKKLYGRGDRSAKLYETNRQIIGEDMNTLKVGQVLTLPDPPTKLAASR